MCPISMLVMLNAGTSGPHWNIFIRLSKYWSALFITYYSRNLVVRCSPFFGEEVAHLLAVATQEQRQSITSHILWTLSRPQVFAEEE